MDISEQQILLLKNLTVLIVENDADSSDFLTVLLTSYGMKPTVAKTVDEALDSLKQEQPNLIISEIWLPRQDGYALMQELHQITRDQHYASPVIAFTTCTTEGDRRRALSAGFCQHIAKPCEPSNLIHSIADLFSPTFTSKLRQKSLSWNLFSLFWHFCFIPALIFN